MEKGIDLHGTWLVTLVHPHSINTPTDYDQIVYKKRVQTCLKSAHPTIHLIKYKPHYRQMVHLQILHQNAAEP